MKENNEQTNQKQSRAIANQNNQELNSGISIVPPPFSFDSTPIQKKKNGHLPEEVQTKMENGFGHDFSDVNIHPNSKSAIQMNALAYAKGNDVHFAPGQFNPSSQKGQELIGHEFAHIVQQREGRVKPTVQAKGFAVNDDPALEKEADEMGRFVVQKKSISNGEPPNQFNTTGNIVQLSGDDENLDLSLPFTPYNYNLGDYELTPPSTEPDSLGPNLDLSVDNPENNPLWTRNYLPITISYNDGNLQISLGNISQTIPLGILLPDNTENLLELQRPILPQPLQQRIVPIEHQDILIPSSLISIQNDRVTVRVERLLLRRTHPHLDQGGRVLNQYISGELEIEPNSVNININYLKETESLNHFTNLYEPSDDMVARLRLSSSNFLDWTVNGSLDAFGFNELANTEGDININFNFEGESLSSIESIREHIVNIIANEANVFPNSENTIRENIRANIRSHISPEIIWRIIHGAISLQEFRNDLLESLLIFLTDEETAQELSNIYQAVRDIITELGGNSDISSIRSVIYNIFRESIINGRSIDRQFLNYQLLELVTNSISAPTNPSSEGSQINSEDIPEISNSLIRQIEANLPEGVEPRISSDDVESLLSNFLIQEDGTSPQLSQRSVLLQENPTILSTISNLSEHLHSIIEVRRNIIPGLRSKLYEIFDTLRTPQIRIQANAQILGARIAYLNLQINNLRSSPNRLQGSTLPFIDYRLTQAGFILIPPGEGLSDRIPTPALGAIHQSYDQNSGFSILGGVVTYPNLSAIGNGASLVEIIPVYLFFGSLWVRRVNDREYAFSVRIRFGSPELQRILNGERQLPDGDLRGSDSVELGNISPEPPYIELPTLPQSDIELMLRFNF